MRRGRLNSMATRSRRLSACGNSASIRSVSAFEGRCRVAWAVVWRVSRPKKTVNGEDRGWSGPTIVWPMSDAMMCDVRLSCL
eukprot:2426150-Prymnesium_polylepis.1